METSLGPTFGLCPIWTYSLFRVDSRCSKLEIHYLGTENGKRKTTDNDGKRRKTIGF